MDSKKAQAVLNSAPFALRKLSILAYANGFTLWHYDAGGVLAALVRQKFFAEAGDLLAAGDHISVSGTFEGKAWAALFLVARDGNVIRLAGGSE